MIRVLVVDDHELVRIGLRHILADYPAIQIAGEAVDGESALRMNRELRPDVVLLDVSLPGLSGFEVTTRLKQVSPELGIVILTVHFLVNHSIQGLLSHADVVDYYTNLIIPIMEGLFLLVVVSHSLIGTRSIILDLNPKPGVLRLLDGFLILLGTGAIVYGLWLIFQIMSFSAAG